MFFNRIYFFLEKLIMPEKSRQLFTQEQKAKVVLELLKEVQTAI